MPSYVHGHSATTLAAHQSRSASSCCAYFLPLLQTRPSARILDVGCGPGTITATLAPHVPQGEVVGVDFSSEAIKAASAQTSLPPNCSFQTGSVDTGLPFPDDSFDVVHTHQVLVHLADPVGAMKEMRRVCKPGGFIASREGDMGMMVTFPELEPLNKLHIVYDQYLRAAGGSNPKGGRALRFWALQAGFADDQIVYTSSPLLYSGETAKWWGELQADRFGGEEMVKKPTSTGLGTKEDVESFRQAFLEWAEHPGAVYMMGNGEVVCWKS